MKILSYGLLLLVLSCSGAENQNNRENLASEDSDQYSGEVFELSSDVQVRSFRKMYQFFVKVTDIDVSLKKSGYFLPSYFNDYVRDFLPEGGEPTQYSSTTYTNLIRFTGRVCDEAFFQKTSFFGKNLDAGIQEFREVPFLEEVAHAMTKDIFSSDQNIMRSETEDLLVETMDEIIVDMTNNSINSSKNIKRAALVSACTILLSSPAANMY